MSRTENVELTVMCLLQDGDNYLLQDRVKEGWKGYAFPGGHIERDESVVDAVIREMKEETGLTVFNPKLCGVKQFPIDGGRYIVFLFSADKYEGDLVSSDEGVMRWVKKTEISKLNLASDFEELIKVMTDDTLNEFRYVVENGEWKVVLK